MIPVNEPLVLAKELEYVTEAVKSGWISSEGKFIKEFENKFAKYIGRKHGIAVNNGTNALILALRSLSLPPNSEVIIPSFTIMSCVLACTDNHLIPVFVDAENDTWNIDTKKIEEKITENTKVIMPVHIYGHPVDMDEILKIAKKYNLYIIEDFAEAIGSEYKNEKCGNFGDISCTSFYANKVITTGEGGMCLTNNDELEKKIRSLRNLAFIPEKRYVHYELGFNFRITNVQAAIGLAQTERIEEHVKKKILTGKRYTELLKPLEKKDLVTLPVQKEYAKNTYWMYGIVLNEKHGRKAQDVMKQLGDIGIQTRAFFYPMHMQPVIETFPWFKNEKLPVSEKISEYGFYLPSGLTITDDQITAIVKCLENILN
ncbi:DegT/DnrJ/EryC1/StrS family aminotransferase [Candidatus Desantisbacteria bacterium]|nr:DegT/DnrJ/EryC1/StrS family aminotransferase [Candidatus Desantisbacteria bacterium]